MTEETQATTETIQTYPASAVVNYFLDNAKKYNVILTPMKLQKMLYFANGWALAFYDKPLISDECQAWKFGPVYPEVYHEYKDYGRWELDYTHKMNDIFSNFSDKSVIIEKTGEKLQKDAKAIELAYNILQAYGKVGAVTLSDWTHVNDTDNPWKIAREKGINISDELMKKYFKKLKNTGKAY